MAGSRRVSAPGHSNSTETNVQPGSRSPPLQMQPLQLDEDHSHAEDVPTVWLRRITEPLETEPEPMHLHLPADDVGAQVEEVQQAKPCSPIWVSRSILIGLTCIFALMLLSTALLFYFSERFSGIGTQEQKNYYGWKYGPTAFLIVLTAFWKKVDHTNKVSMPWTELQSGPAPAEKTLLLDYVTPLLPVALFKSLKNRHWVVTMSVLGHVLLLATTVFSTSLIILVPTEITRTRADFRLRSKFQFPQSQSIDQIGTLAMQTYYAARLHGLKYPEGASRDLLLADFEIPHLQSEISVSTVMTKGIKPGLDCEILPISNATKLTLNKPGRARSTFVVDIDTPGCKIRGVKVAVGPRHGYPRPTNMTQDFQAHFKMYPCNSDTDFTMLSMGGESLKSRITMVDPDKEQRIVASVVNLQFERYEPSLTQPRFLYIKEMTLALCKPSYRVDEYEVYQPSHGLRTTTWRSSVNGTGEQLKGLSNNLLGHAVQVTSSKWVLETLIGQGGYLDDIPSIIQMMVLSTPNSTLPSFLDPRRLVEGLEAVFKGIAVQVLHQVARQPDESLTSGTITFVEDRLRVTKLSTALLSTFLGLLTLISLIMIKFRKCPPVPEQPGSIRTAATILASSPELNDIMSQLRRKGTWHLKEYLADYQYQSVGFPKTGNFAITPVKRTSEPSLPPDDKPGHPISWWNPVAGSYWFLSFAIALPAACIAGLEVLQRISDRENGFVDLKTDQNPASSTYIPALIALGVSAMYSSLEFLAALCAPFISLKRGKASSRKSLEAEFVGKLLPHMAYMSLKARHFAVAVALLGNLIGGFLTIIASGLYSPIDNPQYVNISLPQKDAFVFENNLNLNGDGTSKVSSLVEYIGLDFTNWTYDNLVFNMMDFSLIPSDMSNETLTATVTSERATLNCTTIPSSKSIYSIKEMVDNSPQPGSVSFQFHKTLHYREWCEKPLSNNYSDLELSYSHYQDLPQNGTKRYIAEAEILDWSSAYPTNQSADKSMQKRLISKTGHGCPSVLINFGWQRMVNLTEAGSDADRVESSFATLLCYQNVEQIDTRVRYKLSDFGIDKDIPPEPDESSTRLRRTAEGSNRFEFDIWLDSVGEPDNYGLDEGDTPRSEFSHLTAFASAILNGRSKHNFKDLAGEENADRLALAANEVYGRLMAQAISLSSRRESNPDGSALPSYNGVVALPKLKRLQQNRQSKIALQVLLGIMMASAIVTRSLLPLHETLPCNPYSLAGKAILLAGSSMVPDMDKEHAKTGNSVASKEGSQGPDERVYALKWWRELGLGDGAPRYGIDVDVDTTD